MRKLRFVILVPINNLTFNSSSYEVLSDPQKRGIYDARGEAGLSESGGMGGMDPQVMTTSHTSAHSY
jgi:DnaJ-class molecular chaperone